jgi:hypothetical protein
MQLGYNDGQAGGARAGANGNGYNENNEPNPNNVDRWPGCRPQLMLARPRAPDYEGRHVQAAGAAQ